MVATVVPEGAWRVTVVPLMVMTPEAWPPVYWTWKAFRKTLSWV
jgi:hypothetical protein